MNYELIYVTMLDYLARDDISKSLFNYWLRVVERRINAGLTTSSEYASFITENITDGITLPVDFKQGVVTKLLGSNKVLSYVNPQQYAEKSTEAGYFTIKNNKLFASGNEGGQIEIEYNKSLTPLSEEAPENYVSITYPDLYLTGVMREASLWNKDTEQLALQDSAFLSALVEANVDSVNKVVSGSQLSAKSDMIIMGGQ